MSKYGLVHGQKKKTVNEKVNNIHLDAFADVNKCKIFYARRRRRRTFVYVHRTLLVPFLHLLPVLHKLLTQFNHVHFFLLQ